MTHRQSHEGHGYRQLGVDHYMAECGFLVGDLVHVKDDVIETRRWEEYTGIFLGRDGEGESWVQGEEGPRIVRPFAYATLVAGIDG